MKTFKLTLKEPIELEVEEDEDFDELLEEAFIEWLENWNSPFIEHIFKVEEVP